MAKLMHKLLKSNNLPASISRKKSFLSKESDTKIRVYILPTM